MTATPKDFSPISATIAVFIGGALGSLLRWGWSLVAHSVAASPNCQGLCRVIVGGGGVNIDTWILNLISVVVLAYLTGRLVSNPHRRRSQALKLTIGTGFCGGLGTYGGPVWQIVVYQQFHLGHLLELIAMFAVALPVGLFALWLGTRRGFVSGDIYRDSPADFTLPNANDPTSLPPLSAPDSPAESSTESLENAPTRPSDPKPARTSATSTGRSA